MRRLLTLGTLALVLAGVLLGATNGGLTNALGDTRVRVQPTASAVDFDDGPFDIRLQLNDLEHHGQIAYDDNRDGVPDRFVPSTGLGAFEFQISFNPEVIEVEGAELGDFLSNKTPECFQRSPEDGMFAFGCVTTGSGAGPQGSGLLATVTLRPVANGATYLALESNLGGPLGDGIEHVWDGGIVEVNDAPETATNPDPGDPTGLENVAVDTPLSTSPLSGTVASVGSTLSETAAGDGSLLPGVGRAGTGSGQHSSNTPALLIGAALAAAACVALLAGSRFVARRHG